MQGLQQRALSWLQAKCSHQPAVDDLSQRIARTREEGRNWSIRLGALLAKDRKPYLLHSFGTDFFVFQLSFEQSILAGIKDGVALFDPGASTIDSVAADDSSVWLSNLTIDRADRFDGRQQIIGTVEYETDLAELPPCVLRLAYEVHEPELRRSRLIYCFWYPTDRLRDRGTLRFAFPPFDAISGLRPVFVTLCVKGQDPAPISETRAVLVNLLQPAHFQPSPTTGVSPYHRSSGASECGSCPLNTEVPRRS